MELKIHSYQNTMSIFSTKTQPFSTFQVPLSNYTIHIYSILSPTFNNQIVLYFEMGKSILNLQNLHIKIIQKLKTSLPQ